MSIQEESGYFKLFLSNDELFIALLIVLVGIIGFGLGKQSQSAYEVDVVKTAASTSTSAEVEVLPPSPSVENLGGAYVASKNGTKYHLPWCPGASQMKEENKVWFATREDAEAAGYQPAGNCKGI